MYLWTSWILHLQLGTSKLYLEPLLKTFETPGAFIWNPYLEPWNLPKLYLRTLLGTSTVTWNLPEPILLLGWILYALLGTSESSGTFTWNPCSEPRNLLEPFMIGTLTWNLGTCRNLYLEPLYLEPRNLLTWNPYLEPRNLPNLYLEPLYLEPRNLLTWNPYSEPRNLPEPLLGTLTWNLGARRNLYLEPLLGTSEPARTWRDDCPRVPQGLVWLGPQSFQLLGNNRYLGGGKQTYILYIYQGNMCFSIVLAGISLISLTFYLFRVQACKGWKYLLPSTLLDFYESQPQARLKFFQAKEVSIRGCGGGVWRKPDTAGGEWKNWWGQNRSFWKDFGGMVMQMMQGFLAGGAGNVYVLERTKEWIKRFVLFAKQRLGRIE